MEITHIRQTLKVGQGDESAMQFHVMKGDFHWQNVIIYTYLRDCRYKDFETCFIWLTFQVDYFSKSTRGFENKKPKTELLLKK